MPKLTTDIDPIAQAVRAEIDRSGIALKELAERARTHSPTLIQWFAGGRGLPLGPRTRVLAALGLEIIVRRVRKTRR
jgi:hypothetical protein